MDDYYDDDLDAYDPYWDDDYDLYPINEYPEFYGYGV
jgi:hypothetical protein